MDNAVGCEDERDLERRRFAVVVFVLEVEVEVEFGMEELAEDFVNGRLCVVG